jgi:hypothetical protein
VLEVDNALAQKLEAEISIQRVWADAYAKRLDYDRAIQK